MIGFAPALVDVEVHRIDCVARQRIYFSVSSFASIRQKRRREKTMLLPKFFRSKFVHPRKNDGIKQHSNELFLESGLCFGDIDVKRNQRSLCRCYGK